MLTLTKKQLQENSSRIRGNGTNNELLSSYDERGNKRKRKSSRDLVMNSEERPYLASAVTNALDELPSTSQPKPEDKLKFHFHDVCAVLLSPTPLVSGTLSSHYFFHEFSLTPGQQKKYKEGGLQIHLRIWKVNASNVYNDFFPMNLEVKVNGEKVSLPPKPAHILLTNVNLSGKTSIIGSWNSTGVVRYYELGVYMVKALKIKEIVKRIKKSQRNEIVSKLTGAEGTNDYHSSNVKVSVLCPLGQRRMSWPCRGESCYHIQCFDAAEFLTMQLQNPLKTLKCPLCRPQKILEFEYIRIDPFFEAVLSGLPSTATNQIRLLPNGTWMPIFKKKVQTITVE